MESLKMCIIVFIEMMIICSPFIILEKILNTDKKSGSKYNLVKKNNNYNNNYCNKYSRYNKYNRYSKYKKSANDINYAQENSKSQDYLELREKYSIASKSDMQKGTKGEEIVKTKLEKLDSNTYKVLNDIMFKCKDKDDSCQVDHIVISKYGIFVIETKNFYGAIYGNKYANTWKKFVNGKGTSIYNPIRQNLGHIKKLSSLLNVKEDKFISIICIANEKAILKLSEDITEVIKVDELLEKILAYNKVIITEETENIVNYLKENNIESYAKRKAQIYKKRNKVYEIKEKTIESRKNMKYN